MNAALFGFGLPDRRVGEALFAVGDVWGGVREWFVWVLIGTLLPPPLLLHEGWCVARLGTGLCRERTGRAGLEAMHVPLSNATGGGVWWFEVWVCGGLGTG